MVNEWAVGRRDGDSKRKRQVEIRRKGTNEWVYIQMRKLKAAIMH